MLEEQRRADGVDRELRRHGGGVDRGERLLRAAAVDLERAGGVEDQLERAGEPGGGAGDRRLVGQVEPVAAAREARHRRRRARASAAASAAPMPPVSPITSARIGASRVRGGHGPGRAASSEIAALTFRSRGYSARMIGQVRIIGTGGCGGVDPCRGLLLLGRL